MAPTPSSPVIVFTHVPKTSGTSFRKSLVEPNIAAEEIFRYGGVRSFVRERGAESSFVWGHMPSGVHLLTRRKVDYVTFLRDPIDRAVSYYYFAKDSDPAAYKHPARDDADSHSIAEFYALRKYQNWQTRFVAGLPFHYLYPRHSSSRLDRITLQRAIGNLTGGYACFGMQERFEESLDLLQARFGWRERATVAREKQTGTRPRLDDLDEDTLRALRASNSLDCELYEAAWRWFDARVAA